MRKAAIALAALALCVPPLRGQVPEGAPLTYDNVLYTTPVWSREDPFALLYLASRTNYIESVAALGPRVTALEGGTNNWNTAYSWGDHAGLYRAIGWVPSWGDLTDIPQDFPPSTHEHDYTTITNPPWLEEYTETDEVALAALAAHAAYWPPNATASSWFNFVTNSGAITITGYNIDGGTDVVIPDYINGWPVTTIGVQAFAGRGVTSIGGAGNVVTIGYQAFFNCYTLTTAPFPQVTTIGYQAFFNCYTLTTAPFPQVTTIGYQAFSECYALTTAPFPQATTIGEWAFSRCSGLTTATLPQATTIGDNAFYYCTSLSNIVLGADATNFHADAFNNINANPTITISNPHAKGWGDTLGDMPVVRLPLHGDKIYQDGLPVATEAHVAQEIAAIEFPVASTNYTAWTGTITPANGTATVSIAHGNMPVMVIDAPTVLQLDATGFGTSGVSRVSLSYYTGTNALTFATNVISYAETPTVDTNGWNTLLIRRVSNSDWKGVGL